MHKSFRIVSSQISKQIHYFRILLIENWEFLRMAWRDSESGIPFIMKRNTSLTYTLAGYYLFGLFYHICRSFRVFLFLFCECVRRQESGLGTSQEANKTLCLNLWMWIRDRLRPIDNISKTAPMFKTSKRFSFRVDRVLQEQWLEFSMPLPKNQRHNKGWDNQKPSSLHVSSLYPRSGF